jgi:hypothetical protein
VTSPLRIVVAGRLAAAPGQGGAAWAVLQWALGFVSLGHQVFLVEPLTTPSMRQRRYFRQVVRRFGLERSAAILERGRWLGVAADSVKCAAEQADLLVDLSGVAAHHDFAARIPIRVYVDLDPGFTQLWHLAGIDVGLGGHTHYVTVGQRIGVENGPIPTLGMRWIRVLPPVALEYWPVTPPPRRERFTTVANWRTYGSIEHDGLVYGDKVHSFRRFSRLPLMAQVPMAVALTISDDDVEDRRALGAGGWQVLDAARVVATPDAYQRFIQRSSAEICIAKAGYVLGRTGWFSDRSAAYLASGRPVVAQGTGADGTLFERGGVLSFTDPEGAAAGIEQVRRHYPAYATAARRIAERHLDARRILGQLLRTVGSASS